MRLPRLHFVPARNDGLFFAFWPFFAQNAERCRRKPDVPGLYATPSDKNANARFSDQKAFCSDS